MQIQALIVGLLTASVTAIAFWADGARVGDMVINALVIGAAVSLSARKVNRLSHQIAVAVIYLAVGALVSVATILVDHPVSSNGSPKLLSTSLFFAAVLGGYLLCKVMMPNAVAEGESARSPAV